MKRRIVYGCLMALLARGEDVVVSGPKLRVPEKTAVHLRFEEALSSATSHAGDRVKFQVAADVIAGDTVVISKGSRAWGVVSDASPRGRLDRDGKLDVHVDSVCLTDGGSAPLRAVADPSVAALKNMDSAQGFADGMMAFPAAPILLFVYGKDVTIPGGKEVTAYLNRDVFVPPLQSKAPVLCDQSANTVSPSIAVSLAGATVFVKTLPNGAEINVDGKFFGNTPSTLILPPGDHQVSLKAPGYAPWDRALTLTPGGEITISAALEQVK